MLWEFYESFGPLKYVAALGGACLGILILVVAVKILLGNSNPKPSALHVPNEVPAPDEGTTLRQQFRAAWEPIKQTLFRLVEEEKDGRRRRKYYNADLRDYRNLVKLLDADRKLGGANVFLMDAAGLHKSYCRKALTSKAVEQMCFYRDQIEKSPL